VKIYLKCKGFF